jgi:hypothetical protein
MGKVRFALFIWYLFCLSACSPITYSLSYEPVTTVKLKGNVAVRKFNYAPPAGVQPNQIRNTAAGTLLMVENVGDYFTNAVQKELEQTGISVRPGAQCVLSGTLNDFAVDDHSYYAIHISKAHYILTGPGNKILYSQNIEVKFMGSKLPSAPEARASLRKTASDNIDKLLNDENFQIVVSMFCSNPRQ